MLWLRKILLKIGDHEKKDAKKLYLQSIGFFLIASVISVIVDIFLPFEDYWIFVRSIFLIPIGFFLFVPLYAYALRNGREKLLTDDSYIPHRLRYSPKWRRNMSFIAAAFIFVIFYAMDYFIGYTIFASLVITAVLAMLSFCRLTQKESKRQEMNIPDPRDTQFEARLERQRLEKERKLREQNESDEVEKLDRDDEKVLQSEKDRSR